MTIEAKVEAMSDELAALRLAVLEASTNQVAVSRKEAARLCGVSPEYLRPLLDDGTIKTVTFGNVERVPIKSLHDYVKQETSAA